MTEVEEAAAAEAAGVEAAAVEAAAAEAADAAAEAAAAEAAAAAETTCAAEAEEEVENCIKSTHIKPTQACKIHRFNPQLLKSVACNAAS